MPLAVNLQYQFILASTIISLEQYNESYAKTESI